VLISLTYTKIVVDFVDIYGKSKNTLKKGLK